MTFIEPVVILVIFSLSFILIRKNFNAAIYLMLILSVLLHKELFSFFRWDLLPIRMFTFALLCSFAVDIVIKVISKSGRSEIARGYFKNPFVLLLGTLWLINGASIIFSLNLKASILLYGFFTTMVIAFITLYKKLENDPSQSLKYIKFYISLAFLLTLFGYFQYYLYTSTGKIIGALWNVPNNFPRIGATFWDVNHYGAFLAALLPVSAAFVLIEKKLKSKIYYFIISTSLLVSLLITNSRTAWIMAFISFITFLLVLLITRFGKKGILILLTPLVAISITVSVMYSQKDSPFRAAVKQYFHYRLDSFDSHILLLTGTFEIFQEHPILGGGYGGFFEHFSKTKSGPIFFGRDPVALTTRVPAHTIWGEVMADTGAVGFGYFCFLLCLSWGRFCMRQ